MFIMSFITLITGTALYPQLIPPGQSIELPDDEAKKLIASGFAKLSITQTTQGDDLIAGLVDAIGTLAPDAFGKDGKPHVKALENSLGQSITASMRDSAWAAYQKDNHDEQ